MIHVHISSILTFLASFQGVCKYLSAMTSRSWGGVSSRGNSSNGGMDDSSSPWLHAPKELRKSMRASKGKQLQELVETLGGKPVSLKVSGGVTFSAAQRIACRASCLELWPV